MDYNNLFKDLNTFTFRHDMTRGKKIWISIFKNFTQDEDTTHCINGFIELNVIDDTGRVNFINYRNPKDNFIEVSKEIEDNLIKYSRDYADKNGYTDKVLKRYKSK